MLANVIGGLQGMIDHIMVGHLVGFAGNAAIGVAWQIFVIVIVFISSLFTGMSVLVARFAGAGDHEKADRTVYQAFLTSIFLSFAIMAVPFGLSTTMYITLTDGQAVTVLYGWIFVSIVSLSIAASLAEICAVSSFAFVFPRLPH